MTMTEHTNDAQHRVQHEELMRFPHGREQKSGQRLVKLALKFKAEGSGSIFTPSSGMALAKRDPKTKAILPDEIVTVMCYESEVAEIQGYVEDDSDTVAMAVRGHKRALHAHIRRVMADKDLFVPDNRNEWTADMKAAAMKFNDSAEATVTKALGEREGRPVGRYFGIMPLSSCEVVETGIPAPKTREMEVRSQMVEDISRMGQNGLTAESLSEAMITALAKAGVLRGADDESEKLRKQNDGMAQKIKALEAKLAAATKA